MRGSYLQNCLSLALPVGCTGCGRGPVLLCRRCRAVLCGVPDGDAESIAAAGTTTGADTSSGTTTGADCGPAGLRASGAGAVARRFRPVPRPPGLPPVYAAAAYEGVARAVLLAHKERGALALARPLGVALVGAVTALLRAAPTQDRPGTTPLGGFPSAEAVVLVPVPSARRSVAARGHDPTRRIALAAAGELRRRGRHARVLRLLRQRRPVADQVGLAAGDRLVNLTGALETVPGGCLQAVSERLVLVDDLATTGATLAEAARAVTAAGGRIAGAAVVAAAGPPG